MSTLTKRATIYFNPAVHNVLRNKAQVSHRTISEVINEALMDEMVEDAEDLKTFEERANEENISYKDVLVELNLNV